MRVDSLLLYVDFVYGSVGARMTCVVRFANFVAPTLDSVVTKHSSEVHFYCGVG